MIRGQNKIPGHLPKKLTISFPIWGLFDTGNGYYHDLDKMMIDHRERGFNCMRIDDGAGLMHDINGKARGAVYFGRGFGEFDKKMRQSAASGDPGYCDTRERLLELFRAAKRHGVYVILSSWYYLHTYWYVDSALASELAAIPPHERFMAFAKFLHYILLELEAEGLDSQIAFAEIFNEADGLCFIDGYGHKNHISKEELERFRVEHEEAIAWIKERHPQILFAFDSYSYYADHDQIPKNIDLYNFHNYFLWKIYHASIENDLSLLSENPIPKEAIRASTKPGFDAAEDWYERVWFYNNLADYDRANEQGNAYLEEHRDELVEWLHKTVEHLRSDFDGALSGMPVVSGEGVSYSGTNALVFEEYSETFWGIMREMIDCYRSLGLWGTVVRTCCGPEDPVWRTHPDKLLEINERFLKD